MCPVHIYTPVGAAVTVVRGDKTCDRVRATSATIKKKYDKKFAVVVVVVVVAHVN